VRRAIAVLAALCAGAVSAATGCAASLDVSHVLTGPALAPRSDDAPVAVYFNQSPGRPYREVAQIRVRAQGDAASLPEVIAMAAQDAREVGAEAIIVDARRHYRSVPVHLRCGGEPWVDPERRLNARVTAIVFVPAGAAQIEAPPSGPPPVADTCE
jgi:hypothetical protein